MYPAFAILLGTLWVSAFNLDCMVLGEKDSVSSAALPSPNLCLDCTVCEQPCHPLPPPSPPSGQSSYCPPPSPPSFSGYPSYGTPPSPPPSSVSTYPSYGAPPPPPTSLSTYPSYGAPPPPTRSVPVQCCQYPNHPNPDEYYHPLDDHSPIPDSPLSAFSILILMLSFAVLF